MATQRERTEREKELDKIDVIDREHWEQGPPHEIFRDLRRGCPVHWSEINEYPDEEGFWSVTRADDVREVSLDWQTFSSERGGVMGLTHVIPLELQTSHVHRHGPAQARPAEDAVPARLHAEADRRRTRTRSGRSPSASSTASRPAASATWSATSPSRSSRA